MSTRPGLSRSSELHAMLGSEENHKETVAFTSRFKKEPIEGAMVVGGGCMTSLRRCTPLASLLQHDAGL
jgi:hypothetical protein